MGEVRSGSQPPLLAPVHPHLAGAIGVNTASIFVGLPVFPQPSTHMCGYKLIKKIFLPVDNDL